MKPTLKQIKALKKQIKLYENVDYDEIKKTYDFVVNNKILTMKQHFLNTFSLFTGFNTYNCQLCNTFLTDNPNHCDKCSYFHIKTKHARINFCLDENNIFGKTKSHSSIKSSTNIGELKTAIKRRIRFIKKVIMFLETKREPK